MNLNQAVTNLYRDLKVEWQQFQWDSLQSQAAFKTTCSCVLSVFLALFLHLEQPQWAGLSALVVSKTDLGSTIYRGFVRTMGTLVSAVVAMLIIFMSTDEPLVFLVGLFFTVILGLYYSIESIYSYAWFLGTVTFLIITVEQLINPNQIIQIAFFRVFNVLIGIGVTVLVSWLILPNYAAPNLQQAICNSLVQFEKLLLMFFQTCQTGVYDFEKFYQEYKNFLKLLDAQSEISSMVTFESFTLKNSFAFFINLRPTLQVASELLLNIYENNRVFLSKPISSDFEQKWEALHTSAINCIEQIKQLVTASTNTNIFKLQAAIKKFQSAIQQMKDKLKQSYPHDDTPFFADEEILPLYDLIICFEGLAAILESLSIESFSKLRKLHSGKPTWQLKLKNSWPTDIYYIKFGIKGAIAALTVPLIWVWFALPGTDQIGISVIAILQMDMISTRKKGQLRIFGCLIGAVLALGVLGLDIESTIVFLIMLFLIAFVLCYINCSEKSIAYVGMQAMFAFLIGAVPFLAPTYLLSPSLQRLAGIFLGVMTSVWVNENLWPYTAEEAYRHHGKKLQNSLNTILIKLEQLLFVKKATDNLSFFEISEYFSTARTSLIAILKLTEPKSLLASKVKKDFTILRKIYHDLYILTILVNFFVLSLRQKLCQGVLKEIIEGIFHHLKLTLAPPSDNKPQLSQLGEKFNEYDAILTQLSHTDVAVLQAQYQFNMDEIMVFFSLIGILKTVVEDMLNRLKITEK